MQILITLVGVVNTSIKYLLELLWSVIVPNDIIKIRSQKCFDDVYNINLVLETQLTN